MAWADPTDMSERFEESKLTSQSTKFFLLHNFFELKKLYYSSFVIKNSVVSQIGVKLLQQFEMGEFDVAQSHLCFLNHPKLNIHRCGIENIPVRFPTVQNTVSSCLWNLNISWKQANYVNCVHYYT